MRHDTATAPVRFLMAHQSKGYGLVVMTNADGGEPLIERICRRIQQFYEWNVQEKEGQFRYLAAEMPGLPA